MADNTTNHNTHTGNRDAGRPQADAAPVIQKPGKPTELERLEAEKNEASSRVYELEANHPNTMALRGSGLHRNMTQIGMRYEQEGDPEAQGTDAATEAAAYEARGFWLREGDLCLLFGKEAEKYGPEERRFYIFLCCRVFDEVSSGRYIRGSEKVCNITFSLAEYMRVFGLTDEKNAASGLRRVMKNMYEMSVKYRNWNGDRYIRFTTELTLPRRKKVATATINPSFMDHAFFPSTHSKKNDYIPALFLPEVLFQTNVGPYKYPLSFDLGFFFYNHSTLNLGKKNERHIALKSLLRSMAELKAPADMYEEGHYDHRTEYYIRRLLKTADYLVSRGVIEDWHLYNPDTGEEFLAMNKNGEEVPPTFDEAMNSNLCIEWTFPKENRAIFDIQRDSGMKRNAYRTAKKNAARREKELKEKTFLKTKERSRAKKLGELEAEGIFKSWHEGDAK